MSKVLVDPAALEEAAKWLEVHSSSSGSAEAFAAEALREAIAQPAEAEGVSSARLMNTLAELARRAPLRTLHTICETQRQVSTVKLERYLEPVGDTLADYAFTLRIYFDKLSATLSAVTAERDRLREDSERLDFMLSNTNRKVVAERIGGGFLEVYVEEGFMGDEQYPPVKHKGDWKDGSEAAKRVKRAAIDAAMAAKEA